MAAKFFGQFLLEKGLISREQLLRALEMQRASNPLLGELAVQLGMLSEADAQRINQRQRREDQRFGDLARRMGLLDEAQLSRLIAEQSRRRRFFGEILLEIGALDRPTLDRELELHRGERDQAMQAFELGLGAHPRAALVGSAVNTAIKLFVRVLQTPCQFSSLLDPGELPAAMQRGAEVAIDGEHGFRIALRCSEATLFEIARGFFGRRAVDIDDELARDAFGEFLNIVMGYVVQENLPADASYRAQPPRPIAAGERTMADDPQAVAVLLTATIGDVALLIAARK